MRKEFKPTSLLRMPKLHWVDWLLLALFGVGILFFFVFFRRDSVMVTARFRVTDNNPLYVERNPNNEFAHAFQAGAIERDDFGQTTAEIVGVDAYPISSEEQVVYLDVQVRALYNTRKKQYTMKGRPLIYGQPFTFNFDTVKAEAIVVEPPVTEGSLTPEKKPVRVRTQLRWEMREFSDTYGVPSYIAESVKVGDEMKNAKGETLIKVIEVEVRPAKRWVIADGRQIQIEDLDLKDVYYTLEVSAFEFGGRWYFFDFTPLLVGHSIPLNLSDISVFTTVTEILNE